VRNLNRSIAGAIFAIEIRVATLDTERPAAIKFSAYLFHTFSLARVVSWFSQRSERCEAEADANEITISSLNLGNPHFAVYFRRFRRLRDRCSAVRKIAA